ncbi:hypothetical protein GCM10027347_08970 [Larkinella harenae]
MTSSIQNTTAKKPQSAPSVAKLPVLLFFMLPERADHQQHASLRKMADDLQQRFAGKMNILKIDEVNHPDVFQSFSVTQTPTFVLLQQGIELWRLVGLSIDDLISVVANYLKTNDSIGSATGFETHSLPPDIQ